MCNIWFNRGEHTTSIIQYAHMHTIHKPYILTFMYSKNRVYSIMLSNSYSRDDYVKKKKKKNY
jgi:hypothetical protein